MLAMLQGKKRRYSGDDSHFGPFTWSRASESSWRPIGVVLDSGEEEDTCHLRIYLRSRTLIIETPGLLKPYRKWKDTSQYAWSKPGGGYWDEHHKCYGIQCSDGFLQVFLGPQTHDSTTTKSWCCHLPWTQWRHVRFSLYDTAGQHFWSQLDKHHVRGADNFIEQYEAEQSCPKVRFRFFDYDGEIIEATTHIEEREWLRGEKWCEWLSLFYRPMVRRSLDIHFNKEAGPRKGSWKGGTLGHGIDLLPGELHESAFRRYCKEHNMTFIEVMA